MSRREEQPKNNLSKILTITLNPAIDRIVNQAGFFVDSAGGKGINVARALCALGVRAEAAGIAGGPTGDQLQRLLGEEKIACAFFRVNGKTRLNVTQVGCSGALKRILRKGSRLSAQECKGALAFLRPQFKRYDAVVFSGSLPPGFPVRMFTELLQAGRASAGLVAVDTSGAALKATLRTGVDIIKPNREEAEVCLGYKLSSKALLKKALHSFAGCGIKKVLVSLGKDGLAGFDGVEEVFARTPVVRGGHAVGCGDAALAGFLEAQMKGESFAKSVRYAAACGAANVRVGKPGDISKKGVQAWL
jgi:1-phosphofructokinase family hexose kinase